MYKSPLHILGEWNADISSIGDDAYLLRLRKQLLAEFGLTNSPTIEIKGKQYSKDDVIKTIDELLDNPRLPLHLFIYSNKDVLEFLENENSVPKYDILSKLVVPDDLKNLFDPLMMERYSIQLRKGFSRKDVRSLAELLNNLPQMGEEEQAVFDEELHRGISKLTEQIENVKDHRPEKVVSELSFLQGEELAVLLNKLPDDMAGARDYLIGAIINVMVAHQKSSNTDKAYLFEVSKILCKVNCDEELMRLIKSNHNSFKSNYEGAGSFSGGSVFYVVVAAIIFIIRVATCSHNSSSDRYKFNPSAMQIINNQKLHTEYERFESYRKRVFNSDFLIKGMRSTYEPIQIDNFLSGNSPFRFTKNDPFNKNEDSATRKITILNNTGKQLIVTCTDGVNVNSYFFLKFVEDTLNVKPNERIYLYFGDSLYKTRIFEKLNVSVYYSVLTEPLFLDFDPKGKEIFENEYRIEFLKPIKKTKKKSKKPKKLHRLLFTPEFFKTESIETEELLLYKYVNVKEF